MPIEWIDAGTPYSAVWQDWLTRRSPLLAQRLGPHPADWLGVGAAAPVAPPNLDWLKQFPPAAKAALAQRIATALRRETGGELAVPLIAALEQFGRPNAALVITGQQPGLWGGPCYTLWKALSALAAARRLNDPALRPTWAADFHFVPAFWVAGEDADVAEAARAWSWSAGAGSKAWAFGDSAAYGGPVHPVLNDLSLGPAAAACAEFAAGLDAGQHTAALVELLAAYRDPAQRFSGAFVRLMTRVLGDLGMVVIESRMLAGLPARDRLVDRGIDEAPAIARALHAGAETIAAAQYEVSFPPATLDRGPFVFLSDAPENTSAPGIFGPRRRLLGAEPPFGLHHADGAALSREALRDLLAASPERFSFGAPLRVLVQNTVLPTAVVVLGPGELTYWAQLRELSDGLEAPWPALLPRASLTALFTRHTRLLRKLNIRIDPFLSESFDPNHVLPPSEDLAPWLQRRDALQGDLAAWFEQGGALAPGERKLQEKTQQKFVYELEKFSSHVVRAHGEASAGAGSSISALRDFVHPHGPQERALVWPVLLNAFGLDLPAQVADDLQAWLADPANLTRHGVVSL
ncbi:MAG: bacillithiol biosynthesis protein BshC [Planctomycetota bacterium]